MRERKDGRQPQDLRTISLTAGYLRNAEGSCLIDVGNTRVLCAVTVTDGVPGWRKGTGKGWVTAEYSMLPRSGLERVSRDEHRGGRATEIRRMIGRALRAAVDLESLGERTIVVDCDVIEADGGTRTASITGGLVALHQAGDFLVSRGLVSRNPVRSFVAAVSVGIVETVPLLDLTYAEDSRAEVDLNVVMTGEGAYVEIQGAAEGVPFTPAEFDASLGLARTGIERLIAIQRETLDRAARS